MRDRDDLATIYNEIHPDLCRFLESLLGRSGGLAQEIAQESFLRLCKKGVTEIPRGEIRFWLFRVGRNLALNELNKGQVRRKLGDHVRELFSRWIQTPEAEAEKNETWEIIRQTLSLLPEHQRSALLLREHEEMRYREIALVLNVSESKVKVDVFRARQTLRSKLQESQILKGNKTNSKGF